MALRSGVLTHNHDAYCMSLSPLVSLPGYLQHHTDVSGLADSELPKKGRSPGARRTPALFGLFPGVCCCLDLPIGVPEEGCCSVGTPGFCFCQPEGPYSSWRGGPGPGLCMLDVAWLSAPGRPSDCCSGLCCLFLLPTSETEGVRRLRFALYIFGIWALDRLHSSVPPKMSKLMLYVRDNETFQNQTKRTKPYPQLPKYEARTENRSNQTKHH